MDKGIGHTWSNRGGTNSLIYASVIKGKLLLLLLFVGSRESTCREQRDERLEICGSLLRIIKIVVGEYRE